MRLLEASNSKKHPNTKVADNQPDVPYSIFSRSEKWIIVCLTALAGLFSPLTANIYFPAIPTLSRDFHESVELINLTVTVYMIMQGVAPMFWGPLADKYGRRPCYAGCLIVLCLSNVGLALVPTSAYWALMVLRCLQAAGSASTIAIGAGVIGDISTREERGGFFGIFTLGPMVGTTMRCFGTFRALFWFLMIASAVCLVIMLLVFPETLRALVGNGSIAPPRFYRPILPFIPRHKPTGSRVESQVKKVSGNPFRLFAHVDILLLLGFQRDNEQRNVAYPFLTQTTIGVCFLAYGGGMVAGSGLNGWVLDQEYQRFKRLSPVGQVDGSLTRSKSEGEAFPIEKARMRLLPPAMIIFAGCVGGYGWTLQRPVTIAAPLILHFIIGYLSMVAMNSSSTLMIDLFPKQSSSITACNNLLRCTLAAVVVSVIQPIINGIGLGWTYVILCFLTLLAVPLIYLEIKLGPRFRQKRAARERALNQEVTSAVKALEISP
ncbi:quinidine resistance protein-like protein [Ephemerocybe angulata]|uniref:Quinidine resistance protein-like protein n=1 Tax=Ephemerocybe angulata TaxID=980116 RepID=A0A8H6IJJ6_9AGAR|nr:quinidine resistance protein-like protein [Tulosesus angulatus]